MTDIPGMEGRYAVTRDGRVWSYPNCSRRAGRWLAPTVGKYGYAYVTVCFYGKPTTKKIHRLVAETFIPKNGKPHVNHKNGNKLDNSVENLEWVTPKENKQHAWRTGLTRHTESQRRGAAISIAKRNRLRRKLSLEDLRIARELAKSQFTSSEIGALYGVSRRTMSRLLQEGYKA